MPTKSNLIYGYNVDYLSYINSTRTLHFNGVDNGVQLNLLQFLVFYKYSIAQHLLSVAPMKNMNETF